MYPGLELELPGIFIAGVINPVPLLSLINFSNLVPTDTVERVTL